MSAAAPAWAVEVTEVPDVVAGTVPTFYSGPATVVGPTEDGETIRLCVEQYAYGDGTTGRPYVALAHPDGRAVAFTPDLARRLAAAIVAAADEAEAVAR